VIQCFIGHNEHHTTKHIIKEWELEERINTLAKIPMSKLSEKELKPCLTTYPLKKN